MATPGVGGTCNPVQIPDSQGQCQALFEQGSEPWYHDTEYFIERCRTLNEAAVAAGCEEVEDRSGLERCGISYAELQAECAAEVLRYWDCAETLAAGDLECGQAGAAPNLGKCQDKFDALSACYLGHLSPTELTRVMCSRSCASGSMLSCTLKTTPDGPASGDVLVLAQSSTGDCEGRLQSGGGGTPSATLDCLGGQICWQDPAMGSGCGRMMWDIGGFQSSTASCVLE